MSGMGCVPLTDVALLMELGTRQKVCQYIVDSWSMLCSDGDVVLQSDAVQLTQKRCESLAACRLSIDDVHVGCVIDVKE
jgi:hypothetical protein